LAVYTSANASLLQRARHIAADRRIGHKQVTIAIKDTATVYAAMISDNGGIDDIHRPFRSYTST
jgi:hypothetical protein